MPDKSIRVHLVEISSTLRATQKANIRNRDSTNLQVHWQKKSCQVHSNTRCLLLTRVLKCASIQVIQVLPIFKARFVLIYIEDRQSSGAGFWYPQIPKKIAVNPDVTTAPPLSFRLVLEPRLQFSSYTWPLLFQIQNPLISGRFPAPFKIARKVDELLTSGKSFSLIGGYYGLIFDYGGDHTFGDSESFRVGLHNILTWQSKLRLGTSCRRLDVIKLVENYRFGALEQLESQLADEQNLLSRKDTYYLFFTGSMQSPGIGVELRGSCGVTHLVTSYVVV